MSLPAHSLFSASTPLSARMFPERSQREIAQNHNFPTHQEVADVEGRCNCHTPSPPLCRATLPCCKRQGPRQTGPGQFSQQVATELSQNRPLLRILVPPLP